MNLSSPCILKKRKGFQFGRKWELGEILGQRPEWSTNMVFWSLCVPPPYRQVIPSEWAVSKIPDILADSQKRELTAPQAPFTC